jgi:hypothetical protein
MLTPGSSSACSSFSSLSCYPFTSVPHSHLPGTLAPNHLAHQGLTEGSRSQPGTPIGVGPELCGTSENASSLRRIFHRRSSPPKRPFPRSDWLGAPMRYAAFDGYYGEAREGQIIPSEAADLGQESS